MTKKFVQFDDSLYKKRIKTLIKKWKLDEKTFVRDQGVLLQKNIGVFVPPYQTFPGKSKAFGKKNDLMAGKLAIEYDLKKLFFVPDNLGALKWAEKEFPTGEIYRGKKVIGAGVIKSIGQMKKFHNANRKRNGRTRSLRGFQQMWCDPIMLETYTFIVQRDVGVAKAAIAKGIFMLNPATKGIPTWVKNQISKAVGSGRMVKAKKHWEAVFTANAYGLHHVSTGSLNRIVNGRMKAMETRLKYLGRKNAKESGFKVG